MTSFICSHEDTDSEFNMFCIFGAYSLGEIRSWRVEGMAFWNGAMYKSGLETYSNATLVTCPFCKYSFELSLFSK